jgi:hypothetical protein
MMRTRLRSWMRKRQRGQALVEMAASMVILGFLLLGVIEFGMLLYSYIVVVDATDEAVAYASLFPYERDLSDDCPPPCRLDNDNDIIRRVLDTTTGNSIVNPINYLNIIVSPSYLDRDPCTMVTVSTSYKHHFLTHFFWGETLVLHYDAIRRIIPLGGDRFCITP